MEKRKRNNQIIVRRGKKIDTEKEKEVTTSIVQFRRNER